MSDKPEGGEAKPKAPKAPLPVPVLALVVLNLGATGFVAMKVMNPPPIHIAKEKHEPTDKPGPVYTMDPFVVNLNESSSSRFLKAGFELEVVDDAAIKQLDEKKRAVRDEVLRYLSGLTVADTLGEDNKAKIQDTLLARIDKTIGGHNMIKKMYFSEFMVQ